MNRVPIGSRYPAEHWRNELDPVPSPGSSDRLMGRQTQLIGLSATVKVFMAPRRGVGWRVQERFLEHVNIVTSQVENWGEYVRQKEQHFAVEGTGT